MAIVSLHIAMLFEVLGSTLYHFLISSCGSGYFPVVSVLFVHTYVAISGLIFFSLFWIEKPDMQMCQILCTTKSK